MKVAEVLVRTPVTVAPEATVEHAAALMADAGIGALIVVDGDRLVGIVTDRDLVVRAVARGFPLDARVDAVMSMNVVAVDADADVGDAMQTFGHHAVRRIPVVRGHEVVGLLSLDEVIAALADQFGMVTHGLAAQLMFPQGQRPSTPPVASTA